MNDNFENIFFIEQIKDSDTEDQTNFVSIIDMAVKRRQINYTFSEFKVFYHIAALNNWKDVVIEQKNICDKLNIVPICGLLGSEDDLKWAESIGLQILYHSNNYREYEIPTLKLLYDWSKKNINSRVMYFHTKGVSQPDDISKKYWRWLMTEYLILDYKNNLKKLELVDIVGVNWMENKDFPHFCGNFWMARCDWIITLSDPIIFQQHNGPTIAGNPWKRMSAELWLGSRPYHIVESLYSKNEKLWQENCFAYDRYRNLPNN
jgi:hypothetical protein